MWVWRLGATCYYGCVESSLPFDNLVLPRGFGRLVKEGFHWKVGFLFL